ncbi:MAG: endonuclease III domain-containing protein [Candidatus Zixiibacteriota bacterium]
MKKNSLPFLRELDKKLKDIFGYPDIRAENDSTGALIRGILSANTNDVNRDRAFSRLESEYKNTTIDWEKVASTPEEKLAEIIKPAGMSMIRAERIKGALEWLKKEFGEYSAKNLLEIDQDIAYQKLQEIKGIGAKTAAVFLVFNGEKGKIKYFPVDTHIHRVAARIGIFPAKYSPAKMIVKFTEIVEPEIVISLHINMIELGRHICRSRKAICFECPIIDICEQKLPKVKIAKEN